LTRDKSSAKAQQFLSSLAGHGGQHVELANADIAKKPDVEQAFHGAWAIFALTDFWANPDKPEAEIEQGKMMADVTAHLHPAPYFIYSVLENVEARTHGRCHVVHFETKAKVRDYIKANYPQLKGIYIRAGSFMQNWRNFNLTQLSQDNSTVEFVSPLMTANTPILQADIDDIGPLVREVLTKNPDQYVNSPHDICLCGEVITMGQMVEAFAQATGRKARLLEMSEAQFRQWATERHFPKVVQDDLIVMYDWFAKDPNGYFGNQDWSSGKKIVPTLHTFGEWVKKSGWKGPTK
jgi:uncharacterized protein YbjT (DUF2867 family)